MYSVFSIRHWLQSVRKENHTRSSWRTQRISYCARKNFPSVTKRTTLLSFPFVSCCCKTMFAWTPRKWEEKNNYHGYVVNLLSRASFRTYTDDKFTSPTNDQRSSRLRSTHHKCWRRFDQSFYSIFISPMNIRKRRGRSADSVHTKGTNSNYERTSTGNQGHSGKSHLEPVRSRRYWVRHSVACFRALWPLWILDGFEMRKKAWLSSCNFIQFEIFRWIVLVWSSASATRDRLGEYQANPQVEEHWRIEELPQESSGSEWKPECASVLGNMNLDQTTDSDWDFNENAVKLFQPRRKPQQKLSSSSSDENLDGRDESDSDLEELMDQ